MNPDEPQYIIPANVPHHSTPVPNQTQKYHRIRRLRRTRNHPHDERTTKIAIDQNRPQKKNPRLGNHPRKRLKICHGDLRQNRQKYALPRSPRRNRILPHRYLPLRPPTLHHGGHAKRANHEHRRHRTFPRIILLTATIVLRYRNLVEGISQQSVKINQKCFVSDRNYLLCWLVCRKSLRFWTWGSL